MLPNTRKRRYNMDRRKNRRKTNSNKEISRKSKQNMILKNIVTYKF